MAAAMKSVMVGFGVFGRRQAGPSREEGVPRVLGDGLAELHHKGLEVVDVVEARERRTEHLASHEEVPEVPTRKAARAGFAAATGLDRTVILGVACVGLLQMVSWIALSMLITYVAGAQYAPAPGGAAAAETSCPRWGRRCPDGCSRPVSARSSHP